jgi:hypothetical protein
MLAGYVTAATLGVLLGLRYRVAAAIAASALVLAAGTAVAMLGGWPVSTALLAALGAAGVLQCGYLAGLLLGAAAARFRPAPPNAGPQPDAGAPPLGEARVRTP